MAFLYISEYRGLGMSSNTIIPAAAEPSLAVQKIDFSSVARSAQFNKNTQVVRIHTDTVCSIKFGDATVVAGAGDLRMPANTTEYFSVLQPTQFVSVVSNT